MINALDYHQRAMAYLNALLSKELPDELVNLSKINGATEVFPNFWVRRLGEKAYNVICDRGSDTGWRTFYEPLAIRVNSGVMRIETPTSKIICDTLCHVEVSAFEKCRLIAEKDCEFEMSFD